MLDGLPAEHVAAQGDVAAGAVRVEQHQPDRVTAEWCHTSSNASRWNSERLGGSAAYSPIIAVPTGPLPLMVEVSAALR